MTKRKSDTKQSRAATEVRLTMRDVDITERQAKNAMINIMIDGNNIFTIVFREGSKGSLHIECAEDSNPQNIVENSYPEFFDDAA